MMVRLYHWPRVVPVVPSRVVGLDSPVTLPPPWMSFTGFRSRIMASFMSFLTRRQADRTILMFGICVFMFNGLSQLFPSNVLATSLGGSKPENCLLACVTWSKQLQPQFKYCAHDQCKSPNPWVLRRRIKYRSEEHTS